MERPAGTRVVVALLLAGWVAGGLLDVGYARPGDALVSAGVTVPPVLLGLLVLRRRPRHPVGPALMALGAVPALALGIEFAGAAGLPVASALAPGVWAFHLTGFVLLCLVFPVAPPKGSRWWALPWAYLAAAAVVELVVGLEASGTVVPEAVSILTAAGFLVVPVASVTLLVKRYRRGDDLVRLQLRWLLLGAASVPVLLGAGWLALAAGASVGVAFTGFMLALLFVLPAAVAAAIVRHDVLDVDRLLSSGAAWVLTTVVSAALFALVVAAVAEGAATLLSRDQDATQAGVVTAAFVTALALLPLHRRTQELIGRVTDRERIVARAEVARFVQAVRDGRAEPGQVEATLRRSLADPGLRVLLLPPGGEDLVDLAGDPAEPDPTRTAIPLLAQGNEVGRLELALTSTRRVRLARELAVEARLPIEVSRLQVELRASRSRLVEAAAQERRKLERDLHDGAQQEILAVGMRLRLLQRRLPPGDEADLELDAAVTALERTVAELRRLAHGIRPGRLDDGLETAIRSLVTGSPIPVDLHVEPLEVDEAAATTAYFVVAESFANTLKHAGANRAQVTVTRRGGGLAVEFSDDGRGGAVTGFGLTAMRDRVAALGGSVVVDSPAGAGTVVRAEF